MELSPDLQSCVLCDDVRREHNGKFILIGLFDSLGVPQLPVTYPRLCLATRWCSGEGEFTQSSRILKPDRETPLLEGKQIPIRLKDDLHTATNVEFFLNVKFEEAGVYWVEVLLEKQLKLSYPLRVAQISPHQGQ
jgi:hypothetical protein